MPHPDFLERAKNEPESMTPGERFILGVASIQGAMSQEADGLSPKEKTTLLNAAIDITQQGLGEIRINPQFSEAERFRYGVVAMGNIDWKSLKPTPKMARLLEETLQTLAAGQRTQLIERNNELREDAVSGFYEMGALLMLGDKREELSAVDQVRNIQDAKLHTPDQRRTVALAWAKRLSGMVDDEEFTEMLTYFATDKDDMRAVMDLTMAKLKTIANQKNS